MATINKGTRFRFATFEADTETGELRRQGLRVKLGSQPFQVLLMLIERPGELVTREEIQQALWPQGTFVDFDHGLNSTINRIREALGDSAASPRFLETLARRGYRFLAPVERIELSNGSGAPPKDGIQNEPAGEEVSATGTALESTGAFLASPTELPKTHPGVARTLFLLLQIMYLSFYIAVLANLREVDELVSALLPRRHAFELLVVTAAILIPVRLFLVSAVLLRAPKFRAKFLKLFPGILLLDEFWALSPFLLLHHIEAGVALAATAMLVYSPFAQRSLVLMGAGGSAAPTN